MRAHKITNNKTDKNHVIIFSEPRVYSYPPYNTIHNHPHIFPIQTIIGKFFNTIL
jgi:hypothetical protein